MELTMVKHEASGDDTNTDEEEGSSNKQNTIFRQPPHFTFDNYFADDKILNLLGGHSFGATMTNYRDRLPEGLPGVVMCKEKTEANSWKSCVAHFNNTITMVNDLPPTDELKGFTHNYLTFQSTSSCNITTFNALNDNHLYFKQKERGRGLSQ
jgi:hypothetical protein